MTHCQVPVRCAVKGPEVDHAAGAVELLTHAEAKGGGKDPGLALGPRLGTQSRRDPAITETRPLTAPNDALVNCREVYSRSNHRSHVAGRDNRSIPGDFVFHTPAQRRVNRSINKTVKIMSKDRRLVLARLRMTIIRFLDSAAFDLLENPRRLLFKRGGSKCSRTRSRETNLPDVDAGRGAGSQSGPRSSVTNADWRSSAFGLSKSTLESHGAQRSAEASIKSKSFQSGQVFADASV